MYILVVLNLLVLYDCLFQESRIQAAWQKKDYNKSVHLKGNNQQRPVTPEEDEEKVEDLKQDCTKGTNEASLAPINTNDGHDDGDRYTSTMNGESITLKPIDRLKESNAATIVPAEATKGSSDFLRHKSQLDCVENILKNELPILPVQGLKVMNGKNQMADFHTAVLAHHGDTGDWRRWNRAFSVRSQPLPHLEQAGLNCSVWEVGANTKAESSRQYIQQYPNCQYHAYEPIPDFVIELEKNWKGENRMHIHAYGLAAKNNTFMVPKASLHGDHGVATYIGDAKGGEIEAKIRSFDYALADAGGIPTMLDINCEGCEFDFLMQAHQHGFLKQVPVIQIGWHSYGSVGVGMRTWQICEIRMKLSETHDMVQGLAFGWERWSIKDSFMNQR